jgi:DNA mismatch repair protein MutL
LELPSELVDINVHPQKSEVRFADARAVADAVYQIVSSELARAFSMPSPASNRWKQPDSGPAPTSVGAWRRNEDDDRVSEVWSRPNQDSEAGEQKSGSSGENVVSRSMLPQASSKGAQPDERDDSTGERPIVESHRAEAYVLEGPAGEPVTSSDSEAEQHGEAERPSEPGSGPAAVWPQATTGMGRPRERLQSFMRIHEAPVSTPPRANVGEAEVGWKRLRYVAQVRATYLICEGDEGLFVLDQHAAAERVNFHKLKQEYAQRSMASQALLFPVTLRLTPEQTELVVEHEPDIQGLGFDVRVHSETTVSVHRVPRLLQRDDTERLFLDLLSELGRAGRGFTAAVDAALSTIACHGSVRAGDTLNAQQAEALLASLEGVDFAGHCPHGRPIVAFTSWSELERKVGRR